MAKCDLLLRGGLLIDGTGGAIREGDLAADGGRILALGELDGLTAEKELDVTGLVVAPGFIDVHTHDDWALLTTPEMPFKVTQGVTTVVAGNCGISAAPFTPRPGLPAPFKVIPDASEQGFPSVSAYARAVELARPAVNVVLLAGHSALRAGAMSGSLERPATATEIASMAETLELALKQGAAGLSSGLDYPAALAAPMGELVPLAKVLTAHEGTVYTSHMRDEGDGVIEAVRETLETGRQSGARIVISHHKCAGSANFGKSKKTLAMIDGARRAQEVALDVYPYTASSTELVEKFVRNSQQVRIIWSSSYPEMGGRMLHEIASEWDVKWEEACSRLHPAGAIYFDMDEGDLQRIMVHPIAMIGSDGLPGAEKPHPRLWGTFPRVLGKYVRDLKLLQLQEAVHKMTGLSAKTFNLKDRGILREGAFADIVVFNPDTICDVADFDNSEQPSQGIAHVFVNGEVALADGRQTNTRAGRFLSR